MWEKHFWKDFLIKNYNKTFNINIYNFDSYFYLTGVQVKHLICKMNKRNKNAYMFDAASLSKLILTRSKQ